MRLKTIALGTAAAAMASAPVLASSLSAERSDAPVANEAELGGDGMIIGILAAAAVIAGIIIIADGDDDPVSM
jgi:hypothetical protein